MSNKELDLRRYAVSLDKTLEITQRANYLTLWTCTHERMRIKINSASKGGLLSWLQQKTTLQDNNPPYGSFFTSKSIYKNVHTSEMEATTQNSRIRSITSVFQFSLLSFSQTFCSVNAFPPFHELPHLL